MFPVEKTVSDVERSSSERSKSGFGCASEILVSDE